MQNDSYKSAGVDVNAGYKAVELMKKHVKKTHTLGVFEGLGGFGGLFTPDLRGMWQPTLVSGTDGVGTKLKIAQLLDKHDTVGIDLVAMCVNDIICCGAKPLFFLDYISCGKNIPEKTESIVKGIADGCLQAECALIGGETAEHPGSYADENDYDLAGFCVGIVDKPRIIGKNAEIGEVLIGLASSGVHSNGFSLIRKIFADALKNVEVNYSLCETLMTPTQIYVEPILSLIAQIEVKGIANITGGGFYENIPRCLPEGLSAEIDKSSYEIPDIFAQIAQAGKIPERDMYSTFNMGIGMVVVVSPDNAKEAITILDNNGIKAYPIGEIIKGKELVIE
jgi:phosphoribosylformylglycinamidine cyclo-ligase